MAYVIPEPCIGTRDTACVDASPVDCIHPKKNTSYEDGRPSLDEVTQLHIDPWRASIVAPACEQYAEINANYVQIGRFAPDERAQDARK